MKLGFIGLGNMGNNMALNLLKTGHTLQVTDLRREAGAKLEEAGAVWVDSAEQAAAAPTSAFCRCPCPKTWNTSCWATGAYWPAVRPGTRLWT